MLDFTNPEQLREHYTQLRRKFQGPRSVNYVVLKKPQEKLYVPPQPPKKKVLPTIAPHLLEAYRSGPVNMVRAKMRQIVKDVALKHQMTVEELLSATRRVPIVKARQEAMYRIKIEIGCSLLELGRFFKKDHTTIMHAIERHAERIESNDY